MRSLHPGENKVMYCGSWKVHNNAPCQDPICGDHNDDDDVVVMIIVPFKVVVMMMIIVPFEV